VSAIFLECLRERLEVESVVVGKFLVFGCDDGNGKSGRDLAQGNPPLVDTAFMVEPILKDEGSRGWCEPTPRNGQRDADKHYDHKRRCDVPQKPPPSHSVRRFTNTHNCPGLQCLPAA
jgi:hypothetical protein